MNGRVQVETLSSVVLKDNPLGDPRRREIPVYLPPSLAAGAARRRYPVVYFLPGFTGGGLSAVGRKLWQENIAERFDRLIGEKKCKEAILVVADCTTAFGGSQYVNSSATGRYADHVIDELIPFIDDKFPTLRSSGGRAVLGKSSGGFGALHLAMTRPGVFGHVASHSGDLSFELCYRPDFAKLVTEFSKHGSPKKWLAAFRDSRDKAGFSHEAINAAAMAACYSPNPKSPLGFDLPCDPETAELDEAVWRRWKAFDPVEACARHKAALKGLSTLYFDAGRRDEFALHLGARALARRLRALGVAHLHEEHERGHFDMADRFGDSLTLLTKRFAA